MRIAIGMPHKGTLKARTFGSVIDMMGQTPHVLHVVQMEATYVDWGRACVVKIVQEQGGFDKLLFVDSDMEFDGDALNRLLAHDIPIVGVNYFTRSQENSTSTVKMPGTSGPTGETGTVTRLPDSLFECFAVGTGFLLIDMAVFAAMPKPYFRNTYHPETGQILYGDDVWFCKYAREAGFKIYCDPTIPVGHVGEYVYAGQRDTMRQSEAEVRAQAKRERRANIRKAG